MAAEAKMVAVKLSDLEELSRHVLVVGEFLEILHGYEKTGETTGVQRVFDRLFTPVWELVCEYDAPLSVVNLEEDDNGD